MARLARGEYLDPQTTQIVHTTTRCVRRAFLCGNDPYTGTCYEHRRRWIRDRLEFLASVFAIDCLTFSVMSNHVHLVLRSRPDIVRQWTDEEVARRWLRLCPSTSPAPVGKDGGPVEPSASELAALTNDPRRLAELRIRLSDISWWMKMTAEKIAKQANREDECTGRFWEGRFRAQLLLDEASVLACAMYVDLNPIRAAIAESLEDSSFTGAKARIDDLKELESETNQLEPKSNDRSKKTVLVLSEGVGATQRIERVLQQPRSGWLSPIEICEFSDPIGPAPSLCGRRASLKGFLSMPMARYLELLDWTGRQLRGGKRGAIPSSVAPILSRLGIAAEGWMDLTRQFGRLFKRAAGSKISLSNEANFRGQSWMQGPGTSCLE